MLRMNIQGVHRMRTNIVLDPKLIALAMRKAGASTIAPGYDPKSGDQPAGRP
jgi:hypothetical protein